MIRCSVCCEHVVGYMARYAVGYTLLWDTLLMRYVVGVIGCCVMRVVIVWFKVVFRRNRAVGINFVSIENPEKDTQMTNWMMISLKVKKFNNFLPCEQIFISYLFFCFLLVQSSHTARNIFSSHTNSSPQNRM